MSLVEQLMLEGKLRMARALERSREVKTLGISGDSAVDIAVEETVGLLAGTGADPRVIRSVYGLIALDEKPGEEKL